MVKKLITLTVSIDMPHPKMVKKEDDYIRRKLLKKDFRVLSFGGEDERKPALRLKAMISRLNSEGLDIVFDYLNKEYGDEITLTKVKAIGLRDIGMETEETFEELKKKYPNIERNCPKSPSGIHAIFSKDNMSGCCIYCGKPIA